MSLDAAPAAPDAFVIGEGRDPTAVMGRRIGAYVVDSLVPLLLGLAVVLALGDVTRIEGVRSCDAITGACGSFGDSVVVVDGGALAVAWAVPLLYAVVFSWIVQGLTGATPGKALFGLRVVDGAGGGPGLTKAFLRTIFLVVDTIGCCLPIVGLVTAFASRGHRRVGDMVAGTFVVDRADTGRAVVLPATSGPPAAAAPGPPPGGPAAGPVESPSGPPITPVGPPHSAGAPHQLQPRPPGPPPRPQWDPARGTYVLWDPARARWMAFDPASQRWHDI